MQRSTCLFCWLITWTIISKIQISNSWGISNWDSRPVNLLLFVVFSQEIAAITNTPNDYLINDIFGPQWNNCCHVVHFANLIELSYQSMAVTFQHRHTILLSWHLKSLYCNWCSCSPHCKSFKRTK